MCDIYVSSCSDSECVDCVRGHVCKVDFAHLMEAEAESSAYTCSRHLNTCSYYKAYSIAVASGSAADVRAAQSVE